jgi:GTP:adenosylcobinamide-phosphate guanylyltransferase
VLQECHKSVTRVSQECNKSVTGVSLECHKSVTRVFQKCSKSVPRVSQKCSKDATGVSVAPALGFAIDLRHVLLWWYSAGSGSVVEGVYVSCVLWCF